MATVAGIRPLHEARCVQHRLATVSRVTAEASEHGDGGPHTPDHELGLDGLARGVRKAMALLVGAIRGFLRHRGPKLSVATSY